MARGAVPAPVPAYFAGETRSVTGTAGIPDGPGRPGVCQPDGVGVVVATSADGVAGVQARLAELGAERTRVLAPAPTRRLVLVELDDDLAAERMAVTLRAEGAAAVARPDGGGRLEAWRRDTRPVTFGPRLGVCLAWSEHDRPPASTVIELGPGGFGDGSHPSTGLLVDALLERVEGAERVLDVGCGSGVLGLCALGLGASRLVAIDVKPSAVEATRRNAALNGMEGRVEASADPLGAIAGPFDVVVANVGRAAVVELAAPLVRLLAPGGWLGVSGFSTSQCVLVAGFLAPLVEIDRRTAGDWSALLLAHSAAT